MRWDSRGPRCLLAWLGALLLVGGAACGGAAPTELPRAPSAAAPAAPAAAPAAAAPAPAAVAAEAPAATASNPYAATPGQAPRSIRVGTCAVTGGFVQLYTAIEGGVFPRYGLDVEMVTIRGTGAALAALSTNEIQFVYCAADATLPALASGADAKVVAAPLVGVPFLLITRPEVRTVADLRGKAMGVPRAGDLADRLSRLVLQRHGLTPNVDVDIQPVGGSQPERYQVMLANVVQGNVLTPPLDAQARKDGLNVIYDLAELGVPFVYSAVHASNAMIRDNPRLVEQFVAAIADAVAFTERNPAVAREALRKVLSVDDPDVLDAAYSAYAQKLVNPRLHIPFDAIQAGIEDARESGTTVSVQGAADVATNIFVDEVARRGLFEVLYPPGDAAGGAAPR